MNGPMVGPYSTPLRTFTGSGLPSGGRGDAYRG